MGAMGICGMAGASGVDGVPSEFDQAIAMHNDFRAQHGAEPLEWDENCAAHAQLAVEEMVAQGCMHHNNCQEYGDGQNIASGSDGYMDPAQATQMWYDEVNDPGYSGDGDMGAGHFTQLVWKSTTGIGMA